MIPIQAARLANDPQSESPQSAEVELENQNEDPPNLPRGAKLPHLVHEAPARGPKRPQEANQSEKNRLGNQLGLKAENVGPAPNLLNLAVASPLFGGDSRMHAPPESFS